VAGNGISLSGTTTVTVNQSLTNAVLLNTGLASPTGTSSATQLMMGLGGTCKLTPVYSSRMRIVIQGAVGNTAVGGSGTYNLRYGTGVAPSNGAALTGTAVLSSVAFTSSTAGAALPFNADGVLLGLSVGTPYWFDLSLSANSGTSSFASPTCSAFEF
jgi:hypothetical protein